MKRLPLLFTLLAVIALSASIAYWVLQLYKPAQRPLAPTVAAALPDPSPDAAATLFGGQAVAAVATTWQLTGVVFAGNESVAILAAEGQLPKAVPMNKEIAPGVMIKEVHARYVMLSEGGVLKRIELATDSKANADASINMRPLPQPQAQQGVQPPAAPAPPPSVPGGGNEMTGGNRPPQATGGPTEPPPPPPAAPQQMPPPTRTMSQQPPTE